MKNILYRAILLKGDAGTYITSIEKTGSVGNVDTYTIHFSDGTPDYSFEVTNGYSIISIEKTSTLGNIDTYTVTLDNGETYTFDVHNANVADSMTAQDETTVAPSINAVKGYVYDHTDADGILFCGDFVNVPISNKSHFRDNIALGWHLPDWLERGNYEGLHIKKDASSYSNFATPQYYAEGFQLNELGVNQAIISVEWAKLVNGEYEIHTATKIITDTSVEIGRPIVTLETGVTFGLFYLYSSVYKGCSTFGLYKDAATITGDYYIRKIKIEKGTIATPFGLNKDQFLASSIYKNLPEFFEGAEVGTTDANGYYYPSIEITSVDDLDNIVIAGVAIKVGTIDSMVFFGNYSNDNVELEYKLARDGNTRKTYLTVYFHMPSLVNAPIQLRVLYYTLKNPFATS